MTVSVQGRLEEVDGRKLRFSLEAFDDLEMISSGIRERFINDVRKFNAAVQKKQRG